MEKAVVIMIRIVQFLVLLKLVFGYRVPIATEYADKQLPPPQWSRRYRVDGVLSLPYADIDAPFTAWYDAAKDRSRLDFYGGMDITVQRGDLGEGGQHYQVAPMTTETVLNQKSCFQLNGTADAKVTAQHSLPNTTLFTFKGMNAYEGNAAEEWRYTSTVGTKVNRYLLYVAKDTRIPLYYEMYGYDSLLGSHFDIYKIKYNIYKTEFPDAVFQTAFFGLTCRGFPGPGHEGQILANPMREFIHPTNDEHVHKMFDDFTTKYGRDSINRDPMEFNRRKNNFRHNLRFIHLKNRQGLTYKVKVNHLTDRTQEELSKLRGRRTTVGKYNGGEEFKPEKRKEEIPDEIDWRLYGAVTPVKDQAVCGSCWSFGSTGAIEGALFVKTGKLVRLSQQNLMDCSWGFGNNGCDGGEEFRSYQWVMKHGGLATEYSYGPYLGADGYCKTRDLTIGASIKSYVNVTSGDQNALKVAIATKGPVAVGIDAAHLSLSFYSHGVYYEPKCGNTPASLDHAVLAVGYGKHNGQDYWLVKNSWSTHWGNDGYVLMSQKDNNCGVATDATFVNL